MSFGRARREGSGWESDETVFRGEIKSNLSKTACRWAGVGIERVEGMVGGRGEEGRGGLILVTRREG